MLQATRQTRELSPAQQLLEQWTHETDRPADDSSRSPSASRDAFLPAPAQLAPPAQHGPPYAGHDHGLGAQQQNHWAQPPSRQPVYGRQEVAPQMSGYGPQPHSPPQSYGQLPPAPMYGRQQQGFGQPAVVNSGYAQSQEPGNVQQWHAQPQAHAHPQHVPLHAPEHQAWTQGHVPPHPQGPPQHVPNVRTPSWSSNQSTPPAPAQPGFMGHHNGFVHGHVSEHTNGFAGHGQQMAGHAPEHHHAYGGAVSNPWQGPHGPAFDNRQPPMRFIPVEGGAETAAHVPSQHPGSGGPAWAQPHSAQAPVFGAPPPAQGSGGQQQDWHARPAAPHYDYAYGSAAPAPAAASAFFYAPAPATTARSGSGGSLPPPHQVGRRNDSKGFWNCSRRQRGGCQGMVDFSGIAVSAPSSGSGTQPRGSAHRQLDPFWGALSCLKCAGSRC